MKYRHRHVGRVRKKLADVLIDAFEAIGKTIRVDPARLRPATGHWRTDIHADVFRWEGQIEMLLEDGVTWMTFGMNSWDPMSDCIKGLTLSRDGAAFEAHANEARVL